MSTHAKDKKAAHASSESTMMQWCWHLFHRRSSISSTPEVVFDLAFKMPWTIAHPMSHPTNAAGWVWSPSCLGRPQWWDHQFSASAPTAKRPAFASEGQTVREICWTASWLPRFQSSHDFLYLWCVCVLEVGRAYCRVCGKFPSRMKWRPPICAHKILGIFWPQTFQLAFV